MKRLSLIIISAFFFYINIFSISESEASVINIARFSLFNKPEIFSNSVITIVKYKEMDFGPHLDNEEVQELTNENTVILKTILTMKNTGDRNFYFQNKYSNGIYAEKVKFIVLDLTTGEIVELENNSNNNFESLSMLFKNNRSYSINMVLSSLKNTMNVESALFCLDLVSKENNTVLGRVENTLNINNYLKFGEHEENENEQEFDSSKELKILGNLDMNNILDEEINFSILLKNKVKFSDVILKVDGKEVKLQYDNLSEKYLSQNLVLKGVKKIEVIIKNPEYIGDIEKSEIILEVNYNNNKYGEIVNKVKYKQDKKILIEKISKSESASIGDLVKYEVVIKNSIDEKFETIVFTDFLPKGMTLLEESVKVSDAFLLKDISNEKGNRIDIKLKTNEKYRSVEAEKITYLARVNVNAKEGKNINTVTAIGKNILGQTFGSNVAIAEVKVDKDNFYDKGIIFGRVYLDLNDDGLYNIDEDIPVSGIKIFLENGDFSITDRYGKYSIYGADATTHIAKIYKNSLVLGLKAKKISNLQSENGESRFVDLKKAQLDRSDFALVLDGSRDL
ncbi:MAG: hypothetical protein ACRC5W_09350, partial [Cetobacterium sp.]